MMAKSSRAPSSMGPLVISTWAAFGASERVWAVIGLEQRTPPTTAVIANFRTILVTEQTPHLLFAGKTMEGCGTARGPIPPEAYGIGFGVGSGATLQMSAAQG